jgi:hemolysin III
VGGSSTASGLQSSSNTEALLARPRLRGVSHELAFFASLPVGIALGFAAETAAGRAAAIAYAATVAFMLGVSGFYHRVTWSPKWRLLMRRVDHAGVYALIAGSYTPVGLLVLHGSWRVVVLAIVWSGAAAAILLKTIWVAAPKWLGTAIAISLGWVGVVALPQVAANAGLTACLLLVGGGLAYTAGGLVYAFRRPNPLPSVFGYHEIFHAFVLVAVGLQYSSIAFYVLRGH